jgi:hypothetical protein
MKPATATATALVLAAGSAACNVSQDGANDILRFTPTDCGQLGCNFADSIGVGGTISVQLESLGGTPTAGLDLVSGDPAIMDVFRREDLGGRPAWDVVALGAGVADLVAVDGGTEVDFLEVSMQDVAALTMVPFVGDIVETSVDGYDEAYAVQADAIVSWSVRPLIAGDALTMGRFEMEIAVDAGAPSVLDHLQDNADLAAGYLSVALPAGGYPLEFNVAGNYDVVLRARIDAVAP